MAAVCDLHSAARGEPHTTHDLLVPEAMLAFTDDFWNGPAQNSGLSLHRSHARDLPPDKDSSSGILPPVDTCKCAEPACLDVLRETRLFELFDEPFLANDHHRLREGQRGPEFDVTQHVTDDAFIGLTLPPGSNAQFCAAYRR